MLFLQVLITCVVLSVIYTFYALADFDYDGITSGSSFLTFQPLVGFFFISTSVIVCLLIGLPIRLNRGIKQWWFKTPAIPPVGTAIGLIFLLLAFYPTLAETKQVVIDGIVRHKKIPNPALAIGGWILTTFCLLHFYPKSVLNLIRRKL
jgi:hypothetical protein